MSELNRLTEQLFRHLVGQASGGQMIITARTVTDSGPENNTPPNFGIGGPSRLDQGGGGRYFGLGGYLACV